MCIRDSPTLLVLLKPAPGRELDSVEDELRYSASVTRSFRFWSFSLWVLRNPLVPLTAVGLSLTDIRLFCSQKDVGEPDSPRVLYKWWASLLWSLGEEESASALSNSICCCTALLKPSFSTSNESRCRSIVLYSFLSDATGFVVNMSHPPFTLQSLVSKFSV